MSEDKGKKRAKDQHSNHVKYENGLSENLKSFLNEVYTVQGGKFSGIRLTSGLRPKQQKFSHHHVGNAVDIAARGVGGTLGMELYEFLNNTEEGLRLLTHYGLGIIDETDPDILAKTKGTGPHFHIGPDKGYKAISEQRYSSFGSDEFIPVKSFLSRVPDFDYSYIKSGKRNTLKSGKRNTLNKSFSASPEPFNLVLGDAERSFLTALKSELSKNEKKEEKISESDARKEIEKKKLEKAEEHRKRQKSFIDALASINSIGEDTTPKKQIDYKPEKFTPIFPDAKMGNLPTLFTLPEFENGGPFSKTLVSNTSKSNPPQQDPTDEYIDFIPETFYYTGRPGSSYKVTEDGTWYILNKSTKGKYIPIKDPTGKRTRELNKNAITEQDYAEYANNLHGQIIDAYNPELKVVERPGQLGASFASTAVPKFVEITDNRKVSATTNKKIVPTRDLFSGSYSRDVIKNLIKFSKAQDVDPYTSIAIALQETNLGKSDTNLGHTLYNRHMIATPYEFISFFKEKTKEAKKAGVTDEAKIIQYYNGLGVIKPSTEKDYHGYEMKSAYGVPIPKGGLNMKTNPLYGKRIIDLRDNVIKENPEIVKMVEGFGLQMNTIGSGVIGGGQYRVGGEHNSNDDTDPPKTKKQIRQEQYFTLLNMLRSKYKHLDSETQQFTGEFFDFGEGPIKRTKEHGYVPINTKDYKTWRVGQSSFTPSVFVDTGVSGLGRDSFETEEEWKEAYENDHVALALRQDKKLGNLWVPVGTGPKSQRLADDFGKEMGNFYTKGKNYIPYYTFKQKGRGSSAEKKFQKTQEAYTTWREALLENQVGEFESGKHPYGGVFNSNGSRFKKKTITDKKYPHGGEHGEKKGGKLKGASISRRLVKKPKTSYNLKDKLLNRKDPYLDQEPLPSETLNQVASDYLQSPDLKTMAESSMINEQQKDLKKEAVARHYSHENNIPIEQARELVNKPSKITKGWDHGTGDFAWRAYYNRELNENSSIFDSRIGKASPKQGAMSRAGDYLLNPLDAIDFGMRRKALPTNFNKIEWGSGMSLADELHGGNPMLKGLDFASYFTGPGLIAHGIESLAETAHHAGNSDWDKAAWTGATGLLELTPGVKYIKPIKNIAKGQSTRAAFQTPSSRLYDPVLWQRFDDLGEAPSKGIRGFLKEKEYLRRARKIKKEKIVENERFNNSIEELRRNKASYSHIKKEEVYAKAKERWDKFLDKEYFGNQAYKEKYKDWRLKYSGLPIKDSRLFGGEGHIYRNLLNQDEVIKLGEWMGTFEDMENLIKVGKEFNVPGVQAAFPTKYLGFNTVNLGADSFGVRSSGVQFMPRMSGTKFIPRESAIADQNLIKGIVELDKRGVLVDYAGWSNILKSGDTPQFIDLMYRNKLNRQGLEKVGNLGIHGLEIEPRWRAYNKYGIMPPGEKFPNVHKYGGESRYEDGGTHELTDKEIQILRDGGYKVEYLD